MNKQTPPIDCEDALQQGAISFSDALAQMQVAISPVTGTESVAIRDALDRIIASDVCSPINVPGHANSAMDGYAVRAADLPQTGEAKLRVVGTAFAGHPLQQAIAAGECARIMTGAKMPEGADTVIMQEHVTREEEIIQLGEGHQAGQNVRLPGEDIQQGGSVLQQGRRVTPADLGLLASLGIAEVKVQRRIKVAFFSTGDELRSIGEPLESGQIYDSNRYTLHGMLRRMGVELVDMGVIPDQREAIEAAFDSAVTSADALITTGGVSVGEADFVKETLEKLGEISFWKLAMKPGKPLAFGRLQQTWFFGLPGNPVSAMATFYQFVRPALLTLQGAQQTAAMSLQVVSSERLKKRPGRMDFQRGILYQNEQGEMRVRSTGNQGSHVLSSMSQANCFIVLPLEGGTVEAGEVVEVQPFAGLI